MSAILTESDTPAEPSGDGLPEDPPHAPFNFAMLVGDVTCFYIGIAFLDTATALPAVIERLGGGKVFLGMLLALRQAGYFLPQPVSAHLLQGKTHFQPFLIRVAFVGRFGYLLAALAILLMGREHRGVALGIFALAYTLSWFCDGSGGVPWTALVGKTVPTRRRGRLFATTQMLGAVSGLGVSAAVGLLLGGRLVSFPANLALLTFGCCAFLLISWGFLVAIREPAATPDEVRRARATEIIPFTAYLKTLPGKFRERPDLFRLALVQMLAGASGASVPFLLGAPGTVGLAGVFLAVKTGGLLILAPVWGWLTDHYGPRAAFIAQLGAALLLPAAAIVGLNSGGTLRLTAFLVAYFVCGAVVDAWATTTAYLLEAVPEREQTTYIGLMNAASAPVLLLPLGAGLLAATVGRTALFAAAIAFILVGLLLALSLPSHRPAKKPAGGG